VADVGNEDGEGRDVAADVISPTRISWRGERCK
jgi:hypothetical protein